MARICRNRTATKRRTGKPRIDGKPRAGGKAAARPGSDADRLLGWLAGDGAYAVADDDAPEARLTVVGRRRGASLRLGSASRAAGEELVSCGAAIWEEGGRRRLLISEAGRRRVVRCAAEDGPASPFLAQHVRIETASLETASLETASLKTASLKTTGGRAVVTRNAEESPLDWLRRRRGGLGLEGLDDAAFEAGERLRRDLTQASLLPRVTLAWGVPSAGQPAGAADPAAASDAVIAARQRVSRALDAVGPEFSGLLVDVCGFLKGLSLVEAERRWPPRTAKVALSLALVALARHYGLSGEARGPDRRGRLAVWRPDDCRPASPFA